MSIRIEGYALDDFYDVGVSEWTKHYVVRMLNGQVVELMPGKNTYIPPCEGNPGFNLNLDFIAPLTPLSKATLNIIVAALKRYSQDYAQLYCPQFLRHRIKAYAASAANGSFLCRMAFGV
jgi:hypothetical protein